MPSREQTSVACKRSVLARLVRLKEILLDFRPHQRRALACELEVHPKTMYRDLEFARDTLGWEMEIQRRVHDDGDHYWWRLLRAPAPVLGLLAALLLGPGAGAALPEGDAAAMSITCPSPRVAELEIVQPAYNVVTVYFSEDMVTWHGFHTVPANVSEQRFILGVPVISGRFIAFTARRYAIQPAAPPPQQRPPTAAAQ